MDYYSLSKSAQLGEKLLKEPALSVSQQFQLLTQVSFCLIKQGFFGLEVLTIEVFSTILIVK